MVELILGHIMKRYLIALLLFPQLAFATIQKAPDNFVYISKIDPTLIENPRYITSENFLGRPVPGYQRQGIIATREAAVALKAAHDEFKKAGYHLVVYDAYRPQRAVDEFVRWAKDIKDQKAKHKYYPTVDKRDLFRLDYIAAKSSHTRGSTFDIALIKTNTKLKPIKVKYHVLTNKEKVPYLDDNTIDMGTAFDLFHEASHHDTKLVGQVETNRRNFLRAIMKKHGFKHYPEEWWHYTLEQEPYPDTYFVFVTLGEGQK